MWMKVSNTDVVPSIIVNEEKMIQTLEHKQIILEEQRELRVIFFSLYGEDGLSSFGFSPIQSP